MTSCPNPCEINMAENKARAVVLSDLSAAFDTIDQLSLINRLTTWFGIRDTALRWFSSYLSGRSQSAKVDESLSNSTKLKCGVPQVSVLGPILFSFYTAPLSKIIGTFSNVKHLLYADDTQIYISMTPSNASNSIKDIQGCLTSIQSWMSANKLKLNSDKTSLLFSGTKDSTLSWYHSSQLTFLAIDL